MATRQGWMERETGSGGSEITLAAITAYARLLVAVGVRLRTYGRQDGGLICEDRRRRAHPVMWRISPEGRVVADTRYDYRRRGFITAAVPDTV